MLDSIKQIGIQKSLIKDEVHPLKIDPLSRNLRITCIALGVILALIGVVVASLSTQWIVMTIGLSIGSVCIFSGSIIACFPSLLKK